MTETAQLHARRASAVPRRDSAGDFVSAFHPGSGVIENTMHGSSTEIHSRSSKIQLRKRSQSKPSIRGSRIELSVALSVANSAKHDGGTLGTVPATVQLISASA